MATQLMSRDTSTLHRKREPTVKEIIASARSAPAPVGGAWLMSGLTAALMWASFTPLDCGPVGWICLVPLIALIRIRRRTRWMYTAVYVSALAYTVLTLQWMRLGDAWMYPAWIALSIYMAFYFPLFVALSRMAVHRFSVPLIAAVPVVWVGLELVRAHLMTGFAWYNLSHTQYRWIELIQISDLVGAYGVSFVVAMMSACLAGLLPTALLAKLRLIPVTATGTEPDDSGSMRAQFVKVGICLAVFVAVLGYGYVRRAQADFQSGPRVALIQGNVPSSLKNDPNPERKRDIFRTHQRLTGLTIRHQPDVVIWPETMFPWPLRQVSLDMTDEQMQALAPPVQDLDPKKWAQSWRDRQVPEMLNDASGMAGAALVVGIVTWQAEQDGIKRLNSAVLVRPDLGISDRYDKLHRVVFGEYIPLQNELPWLQKLTPFPPGFGIAAGDGAAVFSYQGRRFMPIICFEDTVPHLVRRIVDSANVSSANGKAVDCLINLTNDGWFHGSSELDQHLMTAWFGCVETRTPMVRAVNTGISAVIDGDGVVVEPEVFIDGDDQGRTSMRDSRSGRWHKQLNVALVHPVPLDNRTSLYVAYGDWFAGSCAFCAIFLMFSKLIPVRRCDDSKMNEAPKQSTVPR